MPRQVKKDTTESEEILRVTRNPDRCSILCCEADNWKNAVGKERLYVDKLFPAAIED